MSRSFCLLIVLAVSGPADAQRSPRDAFGWLSAGVGPSTAGGTAVTLAIAGGRRANAVGLRYGRAEGASVNFLTDFPDDGDLSLVADLSVLYGRRVRRGPVVLTGWTGLGLATAERWEVARPGDASISTTRSVALPLQVDAVLNPTGPLGLGLRGTAVVGPAVRTASVHVVLSVGTH